MYQYRQNSNNTLEKIGKLLVVVGAILGIIAFILVLTTKSGHEGYKKCGLSQQGCLRCNKSGKDYVGCTAAPIADIPPENERCNGELEDCDCEGGICTNACDYPNKKCEHKNDCIMFPPGSSYPDHCHGENNYSDKTPNKNGCTDKNCCSKRYPNICPSNMRYPCTVCNSNKGKCKNCKSNCLTPDYSDVGYPSKCITN